MSAVEVVTTQSLSRQAMLLSHSNSREFLPKSIQARDTFPITERRCVIHKNFTNSLKSIYNQILLLFIQIDDGKLEQ